MGRVQIMKLLDVSFSSVLCLFVCLSPQALHVFVSNMVTDPLLPWKHILFHKLNNYEIFQGSPFVVFSLQQNFYVDDFKYFAIISV
jgi:hypothetical protein